uniref:tol-pal system protein YbgF n=1 Tax=Pseudomaricurvus sp. TaxID=2004510 RepID=UPI003F6D6190
ALLAGPVLGVSSVSAQVQVVDSPNRLLTPNRDVSVQAQSGTVQNTNSPNASASPQMMADASGAMSAQSSSATSQSEMFYRLQALQQEVSELRGMVEEQGYELKRLKQQRLDDYLNLDRRLTELGGKPAASAPGSEKSDVPSGSQAAIDSPSGGSSSASAGADEMQSYRDAIDLVLRQKDYDQAVVAFNGYLTNFPDGRYAANSQYWLGEIRLLQGDLEEARSWFSRLLSEYPDHAKAPDSMYKLGTVYDKLGDAEKARSLLQEVVANNANTNAARLASNYLSGM